MNPPQFVGSTMTIVPSAAAALEPRERFMGEDEPVFSPDEVEQMLMRRINPLAALTASTLTRALDAFDLGDLAPAARLWVKLADRERWLKTVKDKREEAIELRPHLVETTEDTPEAKDQQKVVEVFLQGLRATHALDRQITGGFALLRRQMMESVSFKYAVHHLRWEPDTAQEFELPSGRAVPSLKLTCEYVPLEYFEARTGALRFLGSDVGYTGQELQDGHWMTTTGPALMIAASLAVYEGRLARHDRLNLSEKWGQPGVLGHTTAAKSSEQGRSMKAAVTSVASNYRGVIYGSDRNAVEFLVPSGSGGVSSTPMKEIMEDVKREVTTLFLGGDLSTMSREKSVGASVQDKSEESRQKADCLRLEETINTTLLPIVIRWYFGDSARVLVRVVIEAPDNEDRAALGAAVETVVKMGGQVPVGPVAKRLSVPLAKEGETIFQKPAVAIPPAINSAPRKADDPVIGKLMASARDLFGEATAKDLRPLRDAVGRVLQQLDDASTLEAARRLYTALPSLASSIIPQLGNSEALYRILSTAAAEGLANNPALK